MKNIKIRKKCPFCPRGKSAYIFRTYHGLFRHVWRWHVLDKHGKHLFEDSSREPGRIRIYSVKYSKFHDIVVNGKAHINALIEAYIKKPNPSLRVVKDERLRDLLDFRRKKSGR